ncbi:acyl dehydratase [Mycobacterium sp. E3251]|uniref:FAS1-like dehydratase domain-containing protein n=1 Tax=unclassified Mycobacterium TaxID=2642494 RepID=UPI000801AFFD|nr:MULTISPECIES: MaoC family dehydratase N-terminal domain-containing protein [unclassified Mycobacterium]OBG90480.1 acyl dehydratase [Mycobacterium sp. E3251]OBI38171.1 acyl dehydratase [Mycobacterium sp. E1386]
MSDPVPASTAEQATHLHRGRTWDELPVGLSFRTGSRTVTEADFVQFVTWAGFTEPLFMDASDVLESNGRRLVPAALTYSVAEGLLIQTLAFAGTGIAFLGMTLTARRPVYVGDTLHAVVTITESRATKKPDRGMVASTVSVRNQHGEEVLEYTPTRLVRG